MADTVDEAAVSVSVINDTDAGVAEVNAGLDSIGAKGAEVGSNVSQSLETIGENMKSVGKDLTTYVTLPIVGVGVASSVMAAKFQQNMELLHTEANVPQAALASLSNSILNMAGQVGQGPEALAEAMYHIASNAKGVLTSAQMLDQLKISAEAASMTGANLDDTTYTLSSTLASGITGAKGYADMMGVLNGIVGAGDMKFQDLNAAIGTGFFATGAQFGITVQSMGAALATLTDNGESADEAATRLRMSVTLMSAPSAQAAKVLNALGLSGSEVTASTAAATAELASAHVTTTQLADDMRKPDGINVALQDLQKHLESSGLSADAADSAIAKAFGGGRSDAAILTLLNNTNRTSEAFDAINKSAGNFQSLWATQQQTPMQQFKDDVAALEADMIRLGNDILPVVIPWFNKLTSGLNDLTIWFEKLNPQQAQWVLATAGIAALLGPTLVVIGTLASSLGSIMALFGGGTAIAGAAALGVSLSTIAAPLAIIAGVGLGVGVIIDGLSRNNANLATAQSAVAKSQSAVTKAADEYGTKSPQYKQAVDDLGSKQKTLNKLQNDGASAIQGILNNWQTYVQDAIQGAPGIIKAIAPVITSHQTVKSLTADITSGWDILTADIQKNGAAAGASVLKDFGGPLQSLENQMTGLLGSFAKLLGIKTQITPSGGKGNQGINNLVMGLLGSGPMPAMKAAGGPVSGNTPYIVGEQGPELMVPSSSGNIIPNGAAFGGSGSSQSGGASMTIENVNIYNQMDEETLMRDISWRLANAN